MCRNTVPNLTYTNLTYPNLTYPNIPCAPETPISHHHNLPGEKWEGRSLHVAPAVAGTTTTVQTTILYDC